MKKMLDNFALTLNGRMKQGSIMYYKCGWLGCGWGMVRSQCKRILMCGSRWIIQGWYRLFILIELRKYPMGFDEGFRLVLRGRIRIYVRATVKDLDN